MATNKSVDLEAFEEYIKSIDKTSFEDDVARNRASLIVKSLFNRLETPYETFLRRLFVEQALDACLKIGCDLKLFEALSKDAGTPKSANQLAEEVGANAILIHRVCKHLAATEAIREVNADLYAPTDYSASLIDPGRKAAVNHLFNNGGINAIHALPAWLKKHHYERVPTDLLDTPFQFDIGKNVNYFEYIASNEQLQQDFNMTMAAMSSEWRSALDLYPVHERLLRDFQGGVVFVDVGGSFGHDLKKFQEKFQSQIGGASLILQDQEQVISEVKVEKPIEAMAHDFFTEQPVKGARAFFLKQILHDWPDDKAVDILANLRPAMEVGYTKVLIHELVILKMRNHPHSTAMDLAMMSMTGAGERSVEQWERLIEAAGLRLENVYSHPGYKEAILEVVRDS